MMQPRQNFGKACRLFAGGQGRSVYHHHRDVQATRGDQFGTRARPAGVFGNNTGDTVRAHQRQIIFGGKGATVNHRKMVGERQRRAGRINQTQQIEVLRVWRELIQMHTANGQHDPLARYVQCGNSGRNVGDIEPVIALFGLPRRARQCDQRDIRGVARVHGIAAHLGGERMRRIDQMSDVVIVDILDQAVNTAKSPDALRQRVAGRARHTARQRNGARLSRFAQGFAQGCCLGCAAKDQGVGAHG